LTFQVLDDTSTVDLGEHKGVSETELLVRKGTGGARQMTGYIYEKIVEKGG